MKANKVVCILIVMLILLSGPFALPVTQAIGSYKSSSIDLESGPPPIMDQNVTAPMPPTGENASQPPRIEVFASVAEGVSPLLVVFKVVIEPVERVRDVLVYEWDFEGDGVSDYAALGNGDVSKVYVTTKILDLNPTLTIMFKSGERMSRSLPLRVDPMREADWLEVRNLGTCTVGVMANGTILLWDAHSLLPLSFAKHSVTLSNPTIRNYAGASRLTYSSEKTKLDVTLEYGIAGRVFFNFTEYAKTPDGQGDVGVGLKLPEAVKVGGLDFRFEPQPQSEMLSGKDVEIPASGLLGLGTSLTLAVTLALGNRVKLGGNVWGSGGAGENPWRDQGITPYGDYFRNLHESVSAETGFLTVTQTDLTIQGRGLDLSISRVYAPPCTLEAGLPATAPDYSYQEYPWAPMGNGWALNIPWLEYSGSTLKYIHLSNGHRVKYLGANSTGYPYHDGTHFTLYKHANNTYTLYTVNGLRYNYDSSFKPTTIKDQADNTITFTYDGSSRITKITDTINRNVTICYGSNGKVANITSAGRTWFYRYTPGALSGYRLTEVEDPEGRVTQYRYYVDYALNSVVYPSGGNSSYLYDTYSKEEYTRYRVSSHKIYNGTDSPTV